MIAFESVDFIPICYHPTTVVLVDDSKSLLENLKLSLLDNIPCRSFTVPKEALAFLNTHQEESFLNRCLKKHVVDNELEKQVEVNINAFLHETYRKQRFSEIVVVIVDFAMPNLNGLELAKQMTNRNIEIIMLTGEADNSTAAQAFNDSLINKFIKKDSKEIISTLKKWVLESQLKYFKSFSIPIINGISSNENNLEELLNDPVVIQLFYEIIEKNKIEEYYLANTSGCFAMLDIMGDVGWFIINTDQQLKEFAEKNASILPEEVTTQIKAGKLMPLLLSKEIPDDFKQNYQKYLIEPLSILGKKKYYTAYTKDIVNSPLLSEKIYSLDKYIDNI